MPQDAPQMLVLPPPFLFTETSHLQAEQPSSLSHSLLFHLILTTGPVNWGGCPYPHLTDWETDAQEGIF